MSFDNITQLRKRCYSSKSTGNLVLNSGANGQKQPISLIKNNKHILPPEVNLNDILTVEAGITKKLKVVKADTGEETAKVNENHQAEKDDTAKANPVNEPTKKQHKGVAENTQGVAKNTQGVAKHTQGVAKNTQGVAVNQEVKQEVNTKVKSADRTLTTEPLTTNSLNKDYIAEINTLNRLKTEEVEKIEKQQAESKKANIQYEYELKKKKDEDKQNINDATTKRNEEAEKARNAEKARKKAEEARKKAEEAEKAINAEKAEKAEKARKTAEEAEKVRKTAEEKTNRATLLANNITAQTRKLSKGGKRKTRKNKRKSKKNE